MVVPDADFAICVGVIILQVLHLGLPHGRVSPSGSSSRMSGIGNHRSSVRACDSLCGTFCSYDFSGITIRRLQNLNLHLLIRYMIKTGVYRNIHSQAKFWDCFFLLKKKKKKKLFFFQN